MKLSSHSKAYGNKAVLQLCMLVLSAALLSACGFKLRGAYTLPVVMQTTYIESPQISADLVRSLKVALKASDVNISETKTEDAAVLKLFKEVKSKRTVSVDAKGRAREYTLTYSLSFALNSEQNKFTVSDQSIRIDRDFLFDPEDVLGNSRGESQLYEEMQQDLVRLLLLRLQSKA